MSLIHLLLCALTISYATASARFSPFTTQNENTCNACTIPTPSSKKCCPPIKYNTITYHYYDSNNHNTPGGTVLNTLTGFNCGKIQSLDYVFFIVHGYSECANRSWALSTKDSLFQNNMNIAVVIVDWNAARCWSFDRGFSSILVTGQQIANELIKGSLINRCKFDVGNKLVLIGFSLGASIVASITTVVPGAYLALGVEAGAPSSPPTPCAPALNSASAKNVMILHCQSYFGACAPLGTVDIYFNNGQFWQPTCPEEVFDPIYFNSAIANPLLGPIICGHIRCAALMPYLFSPTTVATVATDCNNIANTINFGYNSLINIPPNGIYNINTDVKVYWEDVGQCPPMTHCEMSGFTLLPQCLIESPLGR